MKRDIKMDHSIMLIVVALLGWVLPGGGLFFIKERKRGLIVFFTITLTFITGLYIGSIGVIDSVTAKPWYFGQIMASPVVGIIARVTASGDYPSYGKPFEIGQIYTTTAGLLNLLCIISGIYMAYCGRGELIGTEEE